jgi:flagellar basal body rod protein FlgB
MESPIDPVTTNLLSQALDNAVSRHAVHAHNLANASTPGFRAKAVRFEQAFEHEASRLQAPAHHVVETDAPVNLATEVAGMTENSLQYQSLVKLLNRHLSLAGIAMNEGKR